MTLPIDIVPGTSPPRFRWRQTVSSPIGIKVIDYEGLLVPTAEQAVAQLVAYAHALEKRIASLTADLKVAQETCESLAARCHGQSEVIAQRAEAEPQKSSSRKGRG